MGAVISLLWGYVVSSYVWMFPQNVPQVVHTKVTSPVTRTTSQSPSKKNDPAETVVGKVEEFKDGEMKECNVGKEKILVIKEGDTFSAIGSKCTHYRQSLVKGAYSKGRVRCPWHGACFSTKTGDIEDNPGCDVLPVFPIRVENGNVIVRVDQDILRKSAITKPMRKRVPSDNRVFVIIGGGPAGGSAAETLRAEGYTGRLVVINREKALPYDRPKLSKVMSTSLEKCFLRSPEFYESYDIELLLGTEVTELDVDKKTIILSNGNSLKYDQALIATGADCQRLSFIPGYDASNVHILRTADDANRIWATCEGKNVLIVGSSFIGMEVASCIAEKCRVTVIGMERVPFERVLGKDVGAIMQKFHESKGVKFIMDAICKEFKTNAGQVTSVLLKNGTEITGVDMVILGAGVAPATGFIKSDKIKFARDRSIIVDKYLYTGLDGLWAAGDLARFPFSYLGDELVRIEHYGMAQIQGAIAAKNMLAGAPVVMCNNIPFFWTVQYTKSVRYCGHALEFEEIVIDKLEPNCESTNFGFVAYYIHKGTVLAVCSLNRDPVVAEMAELMNLGIRIDVDELKKTIEVDGNADRLIKAKLYPQLQ